MSSCWVAVAGFWWVVVVVVVDVVDVVNVGDVVDVVVVVVDVDVVVAVVVDDVVVVAVVAVVVVVVVDVVDVVVVVAVVVVAVAVVCCCCAPRARARQTRPQILTHLARAARARTYAERTGAYNLSQNHGIYDVFAASVKQKLKIRIAKQQKHCILRCFWPVGCENLRLEKCLKHRNLQCFSLLLKTK